jgi:molybdate transport system substrate-binding protein
MITQGALANAAEIKVLSSNGMRAVMLELVPEFERTSGYKVSISYDSANMILSRIKSGETADLAIVTASASDELMKQGKIAAGSRGEIASSGIGIAVRAGAPKPDISSVEAFKRSLLNAKSITYTTTGASGIYFAGLIERLGIAGQVTAKAKVTPGGLVGELVARGEAEIAVQQIPELMAMAGVELVGPLPPELQNITVLSAGVFAAARQPDAARTLIKFLLTPAAARVIKAKGMEPA